MGGGVSWKCYIFLLFQRWYLFSEADRDLCLSLKWWICNRVVFLSLIYKARFSSSPVCFLLMRNAFSCIPFLRFVCLFFPQNTCSPIVAHVSSVRSSSSHNSCSLRNSVQHIWIHRLFKGYEGYSLEQLLASSMVSTSCVDKAGLNRIQTHLL